MSYAKKIREAREEGIHMGFVVACNLIYMNWGKLHKKDTRLKNFIDLYLKGVTDVENMPSKETEQALLEQTGCKIIR